MGFENGRLIDTALLVLRIALGVIFFAHGCQKLFGAFGGGGIDGLVPMMKGMGFNPPILWAWIVALSEWAGGLFLILGIFPRICSFLIAAIMVIAILKVHGKNGFFAMQGGIEYQVLILSVCISLMITGAGKISFYNKF